MTRIHSLLLALSLFLSSLSAVASSIVNIKVMEDEDVIVKGVGVIVAKEHVLTSSAMAELGRQIVVVDLESGAEMLAKKKAFSDDEDLVLIRVPGLRGKPAKFSKSMSEVGRNISLGVGKTKRLKGVINRMVYPEESDYSRFAHSIVFQSFQNGAPVLNNCGEIIGLSRTEVEGVFDKKIKPAGDTNIATGIEAIKAFLKKSRITFATASAVCLSAQDQLKLSKAKTAQVLKKKKEELDKLKKKLEQETIERQKQEKAKQDALKKKQKAEDEKKKKEAEIAKQKAEKKKEVDRLKKKADEEAVKNKERQKYLMAGGGLLALVILLVSAIMLRKRKDKIKDKEKILNQQAAQVSEMKQELDAASVTFNDILLVGQDEQGQEHRLKINGNALARAPEGQTVGRHGQHADHVINMEQISRLHMRLFVADGQLYGEDLGSFNGTQVNGVALSKGQPAAINNGDQLVIGTLVCQVHFL